jgi:large subunit ribosomal protein L31
MKLETHPGYEAVQVICSCGNKFTTRSTIGKPELHIEVCSVCHPFYTGKSKLVDTGGRVDKFKKRYAKTTKKSDKPEAHA